MKSEEVRDDGAEQISKDEVIKRLQALEGKQVSPVLDIDSVEDGEELPFGDTDFK